MLRLHSDSDPRFADIALSDMSALLRDHAHCEQKAAVTALAFVTHYPDDPVLVQSLAKLAHEEASHFAILVDILTERGIALGHPQKDEYVKALLQLTRKGPLDHRVDRLLICALVEARSCERLKLLAAALAARHDPLVELYERLWREEAGHHTLFVELAVRSLERAHHSDAQRTILLRLDELAAKEASILSALPLRSAIH